MKNLAGENSDQSFLDQGLWSFRSFQGDPAEAAELAIAANPKLVAAHLLKACALFTTSERAYLTEIGTSVDLALQLWDAASESEQFVIRALQQLCKGDWAQASGLFDAALCSEPENIVALQTAHLLDFFRGDSRSLRNRVARVLPMLDEDSPHYSFVLGMYAFGLEECNEFSKAEEIGRRAIELNPNDAWATHAVAHVMEMQGRSHEGVQWLANTAVHWQQDNGLACHNWWHKALFHLELGEVDETLHILDANIIANLQDMSLDLVDLSSMLTRLQILGVDVDERARDAAARWRTKLDSEAGYYAFNDFHCALAFEAAGQLDEVQRLRTMVSDRHNTAGVTSQWMNETLGLPLIDAIYSYGKGDMQTASRIFDQTRPMASGFGGSNAQRDVIAWLHMDACEKGGNRREALRVVNERVMAKPEEQLGRTWHTRLTN